MTENELMHYGVLGMKWGRRKAAPTTVKSYKGDSAVTRRVKNDYNSMSDAQFRRKYQTTKRTYAKRVDRYGDPYMNSPMAKMGKKLQAKQNAKAAKKARPNYSSDHIESRTIKKKKVSEMSNAELKKVNERLNLERNYSSMNSSTMQKGMKFLSTTAVTTTTLITLYNNSDKLINIGKKVLEKRAGD